MSIWVFPFLNVCSQISSRFASSSIFYQCKPLSVLYTRQHLVLVCCFRFHFSFISKGCIVPPLVLPPEFMIPASPPNPLDLRFHVLFHLQSFPLFANILGLFYPINKTKHRNKKLPSTPLPSPHFIFSSPSFPPSGLMSFSQLLLLACLSLHHWNDSLPSHSTPSFLLSSSVFPNLSLQH